MSQLERFDVNSSLHRWHMFASLSEWTKTRPLEWIGNSLTQSSTEVANGGADPDCFHTKPSPWSLLQGQDKTSASAIDYRNMGQNCGNVGVNSADWSHRGASAASGLWILRHSWQGHVHDVRTHISATWWKDLIYFHSGRPCYQLNSLCLLALGTGVNRALGYRVLLVHLFHKAVIMAAATKAKVNGGHGLTSIHGSMSEHITRVPLFT